MNKKTKKRKNTRSANRTFLVPANLSTEQLNQVFLDDENGKRFPIIANEEFSVLRQYSSIEFEKLLFKNPSFLAEDKKCFERFYVRNMCYLYFSCLKDSLEDCKQIKKFWIQDLERALAKLEREYPEQYSLVCNDFCINPKNRCTTNKPLLLSKFHTTPLIILSSWGFAELYSPHLSDAIPKIAKKMYSTAYMSETEKAKYAHLFFLFIKDFNKMSYDKNFFEIMLLEKEKSFNSSLSADEKESLYDETIQTLFEKTEKTAFFTAHMLQNVYEEYFAKLPEESISIDIIQYWLEMIDFKYKLLMLNFFDLLSKEDKIEFRANNLFPLCFTNTLRILKEQIFPCGEWATGIEVFMCKPDKKIVLAMCKAYNNFANNGFVFGEGVESYKKLHTEKYYTLLDDETITLIEQPGYLYAKAPKALRISDPNELKMFVVHKKIM